MKLVDLGLEAAARVNLTNVIRYRGQKFVVTHDPIYDFGKFIVPCVWNTKLLPQRDGDYLKHLADYYYYYFTLKSNKLFFMIFS